MKLSESDLREPELMAGVIEVMDLLVIRPKLTPLELPDLVMFSSHSLQIVCQRALKSVNLLELVHVHLISLSRVCDLLGKVEDKFGKPGSSQKLANLV